MDLGPTILELAEIDIPKTMEAKTLLPALQGKDWTPREYVFAEHGRDGILQETEFVSMVRSNDWKLVHFLDEPSGCVHFQVFQIDFQIIFRRFADSTGCLF
jgi:arylsulfatase A-like enzyme